MATVVSSGGVVAPRAAGNTKRIDGPGFDWMMILSSIWFLSGLLIDGWAHTHGKVDQTFFTPWHAIFYSGFAATAGIILAAWTINHRRGYSWAEAIPTGYRLTLIGAAIFAVGGAFDLVWHTVFGIEVDIEALFSPSHLILGVGLFLIMSGPFRAAWQRTESKTSGFFANLPMLLSLVFTLSVCTFLTFPLHSFHNEFAGGSLSDTSRSGLLTIAGMSSVLFESALLMGFVLVAIRRWKLPFGSLTLLLTINTAALAVVSSHWWILLVAIPTGLLGDIFIRMFNPSVENRTSLRVFAFGFPATLYLLYFIGLNLTEGVWWRIHLWGGAIALAGVVGLLLSYVMVSPLPKMGELENSVG